MKVIKETLAKVPEVEDKLQGIADPVLTVAKQESEKNQEKYDEVVTDATEFDRKKLFLGAEKQPIPEEAEQELKKINLDESLFDNENDCCNEVIDEKLDMINKTAAAMVECQMKSEIGTMRSEALAEDYNSACTICNSYINECNEYRATVDDDYQVEGLEFVTDGLDIKEAKSDIELPEVGATIRIINMEGEPNYAGKEGVITHIDDIGQLHGTWGGLAVIPGTDEFEVI